MKVNWSNVKESKIPFPLNTYEYEASSSYLFFISDDCGLLFLNLEVIVLQLSLDDDKNTTISPKLRKSIQFLGNEERISGVVQKKSSNVEVTSTEFLLYTTKGNIYAMTVDSYDYYFEVISFKIRQNYIYNYKIHSYCGNKILIEFDANLYLCEISPLNTLTKSCLLKINYSDEKLIDAYIEESNLVIIYSNKFVYLINLNLDGMPQILFKKDPSHSKFNFSGVLFNERAYFIKDECTLGIQHLVDLDNKMTIKVSTKNYLNKVNFYKVLYVNQNVIVITNEIQNELYFLNHKTYKLVHRETVLFERRLYSLVKKHFVIIGLNLSSFTLKYKVGSFQIDVTTARDTREPNGNSNKDTIPDSLCDLSEIEKNYNCLVQKESEHKLKILQYKRKILVILNELKCNINLYNDANIKLVHHLTYLNNMISTHQFITRVMRKMFSLYVAYTRSYFHNNLALNYKTQLLPYMVMKYKEKVLFLIDLSISNKDHISYLKLKKLFITIDNEIF